MHNYNTCSAKDDKADLNLKDRAYPCLSLSYKCSSTGSLQLTGAREINPYTVLEFESRHRKPESTRTSPQEILQFIKGTAAKKWEEMSFRRIVSKNFPTLSAMRHYKVREYLPNDAIAGLTAGVTMIPQGMAFASLSTLPPIIGLYISFAASLVYFLLGTCHHLSWGCVAVLSILMGDILDSYEAKVGKALNDKHASSVAPTMHQLLNVSEASQTMSVLLSINISSTKILTQQIPDYMSIQKKIEVASAVTLISGIILACLGKIGLGRMTSFMSDSLITGFTVGVSFHVVSSQMKTALGLDFPRQRGVFKLIHLWILLLSNIHKANPATLLVSMMCMAILYIVKRFVNEKYKTRLPVPVPVELFVVIAATIITFFADLSHEHSVDIVKDIPVGVPYPKLPDLSLGTDYVLEGIVIILISFTQNVAMAKLMGLKHSYRIDANQEMFACGMVSVMCSFFSGFISGASVSRSIVQEGAGGKTQVASLFAAALVFFVIMLIGPYFYYLPKCVLAAIVIINLRSMFLKIFSIPSLWRRSSVDASVWIITCVATVFLNTDMGLLVGIIVCILFVLMRSQVGIVDVLSEFHAGDLCVWRSDDKYIHGNTIEGVKIIRINSALYFANAEIMTEKVFKKTGINLLKQKKEKFVNSKFNIETNTKNAVALNPEIKTNSSTLTENDVSVQISLLTNAGDYAFGENSVRESDKAPPSDDSVPFQYLIVDLTPVSFIDVMGVQALECLITKCTAHGINVYFSCAQERCVDTLQKSGFLRKYEVFLTIEAAVKHVSAGLKM